MWSPTSWKNYPIKQAIVYSREEEYHRIINTLSKKPPLVSATEIDCLNNRLTEVAKNNAFILQGGDCAESFNECTLENITSKLSVLLKMSLVLETSLNKPIVLIGRIAGQYAKPRSNSQETIKGYSLPSYRGDLINGYDFTELSRHADPKRMLNAYHVASTTLNHLKLLINSASTLLPHTKDWCLNFLDTSVATLPYKNITQDIDKKLIKSAPPIKAFYTSHEALHLPYESALTRKINDKWYNTSTHFPWLGMRTNDIEGAHIEYLRGIENPIAIKIGPSATPQFIEKLIKKLNPQHQPGKLTLISRLGCSAVDTLLPSLIRSAQDTGIPVLWSCDPMHGNTVTTKSNHKTRHFDDIYREMNQTLRHHLHEDSHLNGVHLELSGESVTECLGGTCDIKEQDLTKTFKSLVDPRLSYEQAMEIIFKLTQTLK